MDEEGDADSDDGEDEDDPTFGARKTKKVGRMKQMKESRELGGLLKKNCMSFRVGRLKIENGQLLPPFPLDERSRSLRMQTTLQNPTKKSSSLRMVREQERLRMLVTWIQMGLGGEARLGR